MLKEFVYCVIVIPIIGKCVEFDSIYHYLVKCVFLLGQENLKKTLV